MIIYSMNKTLYNISVNREAFTRSIKIKSYT